MTKQLNKHGQKKLNTLTCLKEGLLKSEHIWCRNMPSAVQWGWFMYLEYNTICVWGKHKYAQYSLFHLVCNLRYEKHHISVSNFDYLTVLHWLCYLIKQHYVKNGISCDLAPPTVSECNTYPNPGQVRSGCNVGAHYKQNACMLKWTWM